MSAVKSQMFFAQRAKIFFLLVIFEKNVDKSGVLWFNYHNFISKDADGKHILIYACSRELPDGARQRRFSRCSGS